MSSGLRGVMCTRTHAPGYQRERSREARVLDEECQATARRKTYFGERPHGRNYSATGTQTRKNLSAKTNPTRARALFRGKRGMAFRETNEFRKGRIAPQKQLAGGSVERLQRILREECSKCHEERRSRELVAMTQSNARFQTEFNESTSRAESTPNRKRAHKCAAETRQGLYRAIAEDRATAEVVAEKPHLDKDKLTAALQSSSWTLIRHCCLWAPARL